MLARLIVLYLIVGIAYARVKRASIPIGENA